MENTKSLMKIATQHNNIVRKSLELKINADFHTMIDFVIQLTEQASHIAEELRKHNVDVTVDPQCGLIIIKG